MRDNSPHSAVSLQIYTRNFQLHTHFNLLRIATLYYVYHIEVYIPNNQGGYANNRKNQRHKTYVRARLDTRLIYISNKIFSAFYRAYTDPNKQTLAKSTTVKPVHSVYTGMP